MKFPFKAKVAVLFILSYLVLFLLAALNPQMQDWESFITPLIQGHPSEASPFYDPLFLLIPIPAFFLVFMGIKWVNDNFDKIGDSYFFPIGFVIVSYAAFFTAASAFYMNNYLLYYTQTAPDNAFGKALQQSTDYVLKNFTSLILGNAFFVFALAGVLGWVSYKIVHYWQALENSAPQPVAPASPASSAKN